MKISVPFDKRRADCLGKLDKSNIGFWDDKIKGLCEKINKRKEFYTTSSCAGRIVLLKQEDKKGENRFVFRTHDKISFEDLKKELSKIEKSKEKGREKGVIYFKQEACILHVACRDLGDAQDFLKKAKLSGWKKSGIMNIGERIMLELMSTEAIVFPIMDKGKILVSDGFLKLIVKEANKKLERSWEKIQNFERMI